MWQLYKHRKGPLYLRSFSVVHSENMESLEAYRCLYDNDTSPHWVRPSEMFFEQVDGKARFEHLGDVEVLSPEDHEEVHLFGYDTWKKDGESQTLSLIHI